MRIELDRTRAVVGRSVKPTIDGNFVRPLYSKPSNQIVERGLAKPRPRDLFQHFSSELLRGREFTSKNLEIRANQPPPTHELARAYAALVMVESAIPTLTRTVRSLRRARYRRDITVPIGTSIISAASR